MTTEILPSQSSPLKKNLGMGITPTLLILIAIMIFSLGLHFYNIQSIGDSNTYYTAAVKSMTQSWGNFFFVAAEPGGSVTVDKPPLGLWVEAAFAYFLGVSGFSTSLPNILAGVFGIPILYVLVKKYADEIAALIAAFVMATTPIFLATNRNNTMDGMLVFTLLLAAWAFVHATETGKFRWVLIGALLVGLGFNIKMSQALLPLPTFYALYFFGSKQGWVRKAVNLTFATLLLIVVSFSWAIAVDLVPAAQRPYIGSSKENSVIGLIMEHNGASRLVDNVPQRNYPQQNGQPPMGVPNGQSGSAQFSQDTGNPSVLRFFTTPLSKQMSWLLPFALLSIAIVFFSSKIKFPIETNAHKALILWGGWLLTCVVFFNMVSGIFHAYYTIMLVPPLGAMVGIGFAQVQSWSADHKWATVLLIISALITLGFDFFAAYQYNAISVWIFAAVILFALGISLVGFQKRAAYALILSAMLFIPLYWSIMTVASSANQNLPTAYIGGNIFQNADGHARMQNPPRNKTSNEKMLAYLQANTQGMKYLAAVPSSQQGAQWVIETGRPVLYMGGFSGQDNVVSVDGLKFMVAHGELRYILYGSEHANKTEISNWLKTSCAVVSEFSQGNNGGAQQNQMMLYQCK